jgi:nucleosome binding factor SPN SPT16 subunit
MQIGVVPNEKPSGSLSQEWESLLNKLSLPTNDCMATLNEIYSSKDNTELDYLKLSSKYSCFVMESLIRKFETIVDQDKKVTHDTLSGEMITLTEKPQFIKKFIDKVKQNVDEKAFSLMFNPIIQSGGKYDISNLCTNNNDNLSSDIVILKVGSKYKDYNTILTRTFMIDSDKVLLHNLDSTKQL